MKISCFSDFAAGDTLTQRAEYLAQAGFDALEFVGMPLDVIMPTP